MAEAAGEDHAELSTRGTEGEPRAIGRGRGQDRQTLHRRRAARPACRRRRVGRNGDRHRRDARAAGRRAQADGLDDGLGRHRPYVGANDVTMMYSVVDIAGINRDLGADPRQRRRPIAGMVKATVAGRDQEAARRRDDVRRHDALRQRGTELLDEPATRSSSSTRRARAGRRWRRSARGGILAGVLDITTTELADELVGGILSAGPDRLEAAGRRRPASRVARRARHGQFRPARTVPERFADRMLYMHNPTVTLMRTTPEECAELGAASPQAQRRRRAGRALRAARAASQRSTPTASRSTTPRPTRRSSSALREGLDRRRSRSRDRPRRQRPARSRPRWPTACTSSSGEARDDEGRGLERLRAQVEQGRPIIGAGAGTGLSAKCAEAGGADLIIIYNSGRYRMAGRGSLAGLMPYGDANAIVMDMAREVLPVVARHARARRACAGPTRSGCMPTFLDEVGAPVSRACRTSRPSG